LRNDRQETIIKTMSPRPQKATDAQLFEAAYRLMNRVGPRGLTLAAIAKEAGVTAAVLVQRFGSKRQLLLALSEKYANSGGDYFVDLEKQHSSPLAAIRAYAACMAGMASSPAALARSLAYLQIDMTDRDFRKYLVKHSRTARAGLERLIRAAVAAGELRREVKPAQLARTLEALLSGSMIVWGFYRDGTAEKWMRDDLDAVLRPWLTRRPAR
jgi:AcrR family transcriptional regulator